MSHYNPENQVKSVEVGAVIYSYFVVDYTKTMFEGQVNAQYTKTKSEVLAFNSRMMVLNNDQFTRVNIDGTNYAGNNELNNPYVNLYLDDDNYGDGFMFSLYSEQDLSPAQIKQLIADSIAKSRKALFDMNLGFIDNVGA